MPPLLTIPLAAIAGGLFCTLLLLPCLPLRGVYFAIVTLMYPLFMARIIEAFDIFGGTDGILGIDSFPSAFVEQYFVVGILLVFLFGLRRLVNTDMGLIFTAVMDNDQAVRASGINITHYKALAVFIASAMGCLAGACLTHIYMWSGISQFALDFSILPIAATVIGGAGTLAGPVIGCLILVPVSELLRDFGTLRIVFYATILVAFILFRSDGIMAFAKRKYEQIERWTQV
jgi:branched-chain amino acid transport system permease protein